MSSKRLFWASVVMAGMAASSWASDAAGPDYLKVKDLTPVKVLATPQHAPVVLVTDGQPKAKVYVAVEKPSATLDILVKELVGTVKMSTGAELEIVKEVPARDLPAIVIGDCDASRAADIQTSAAAGIDRFEWPNMPAVSAVTAVTICTKVEAFPQTLGGNLRRRVKRSRIAAASRR